MLIAQISDTHIVEANKLAYGIAPTAENLARCIQHINAHVPAIDMVLISGDITNNGKFEELLHAKSLFDQLNIPYFIIPGNHDKREDVWSVFKGSACPAKDSRFINYVIKQGALRVIALDSTIPYQSGGEICEERASWLDQTLKEDPQQATIIFMHHPPVKCGVIETDEDGFIGAHSFSQVIQKYPHIKAILCGHIHRQAHTLWHNTVVSIAPSMGLRLKLDLTQEEESQFSLDDPAYQLHYVTAKEQLISYAVTVSSPKRYFTFEEQ